MDSDGIEIVVQLVRSDRGGGKRRKLDSMPSEEILKKKARVL